MTDFVALQGDAASYLATYAPAKRIASAWPFTDAVERPEFGYVSRPLHVQRAEDFRLGSLADLDRRNIDVLVVFSQIWRGPVMDYEFVRDYLLRYWDYRPEATAEQIRNGIGFVPAVRWSRGGQWIEIYVPE